MHSPPPCGEGLGVGVARFLHRWPDHYLAASPPSPPLPHKGGGSTASAGREHTESEALREQRSRRADEIDRGGLVRLRREADDGGAGGGERLGDLAGETKLHGRERTLENAGARGAVEISLRAAP